jgi:uncharacterized protein
MGNIGPWTERWVVVCGGTSGLGLQLVVAAAQQKANLIIIGRDILRLETAKAVALEHGANSATTYSIDLSLKDPSLTSPLPLKTADESLFREWLANHQVDLLVNAVGRSDRGPLEKLSDTELASMLNDNVMCTWNMIRMSLDSIKRARGTIVNIGSLAGLVPAPGMGGYCVAKSALTAMSRQLRVELASFGVHVLLVCPGPISRDDSGSRYQKIAQQRGLENASATKPGGGVKLRTIDPKALCQKILDAAHRRQRELVTPVKASFLAGISNVWPGLADWILKKYVVNERKIGNQ